MDHRLPFRLRPAPEFDFDEWSALYRNDPVAFEARRSALIAIELARGGQYTAPTARLLLQLQERSKGLTPEQRLHLATEAMLESGRMLAQRLGQMSDELDRLGIEPETAAGAAAIDSTATDSPASESGVRASGFPDVDARLADTMDKPAPPVANPEGRAGTPCVDPMATRTARPAPFSGHLRKSGIPQRTPPRPGPAPDPLL